METQTLPVVDVRELFAEIAHDAWSGWMKYMFSKCNDVSGDITIPENWFDRWTRQMNTPYAELPESEKESDRVEADKYLRVLVEKDLLR